MPDALDSAGAQGETASLESALALVLRRIVETRPQRFVGVQEALVMSRQLEQQFPELDRELRQSTPLPRVAEVCRRLLEERISLRDWPGIAQALVDHAAREKDTTQLVEKVRQALSEQITHQYTNPRGELTAVILSPELEEQLTEAVRVNVQRSSLALPISAKEALLHHLGRSLRSNVPGGPPSVLLVHTSALRPALRALLRDSPLEGAAVLAADELRPHLDVLVAAEIDPGHLRALAPELTRVSAA
jgi:type III secretion protein V